MCVFTIARNFVTRLISLCETKLSGVLDLLRCAPPFCFFLALVNASGPAAVVPFCRLPDAASSSILSNDFLMIFISYLLSSFPITPIKSVNGNSFDSLSAALDHYCYYLSFLLCYLALYLYYSLILRMAASTPDKLALLFNKKCCKSLFNFRYCFSTLAFLYFLVAAFNFCLVKGCFCGLGTSGATVFYCCYSPNRVSMSFWKSA